MHMTEGVTPGIWFHHNGDFSGEVEITLEDSVDWPNRRELVVERIGPPEGSGFPGRWAVRMPFADLKRLVAEYVRDRHVGELEETSDDELLGLPPERRDESLIGVPTVLWERAVKAWRALSSDELGPGTDLAQVLGELLGPRR